MIAQANISFHLLPHFLPLAARSPTSFRQEKIYQYKEQLILHYANIRMSDYPGGYRSRSIMPFPSLCSDETNPWRSFRPKELYKVILVLFVFGGEDAHAGIVLETNIKDRK